MAFSTLASAKRTGVAVAFLSLLHLKLLFVNRDPVYTRYTVLRYFFFPQRESDFCEYIISFFFFSSFFIVLIFFTLLFYSICLPIVSMFFLGTS